MLLDNTVAEAVLMQTIDPYLDQLKTLHNKARDFAINFDGAMYHAWPMVDWFPEDKVEVSSVKSTNFRALWPMYADCYYFRGFIVHENGTDSGLIAYQPFMPPHPETTYPLLVPLNTPRADWLTPRLETLVTKVDQFTKGLEKHGRVLHARRLDLYRGSRQK